MIGRKNNNNNKTKQKNKTKQNKTKIKNKKVKKKKKKKKGNVKWANSNPKCKYYLKTKIKGKIFKMLTQFARTFSSFIFRFNFNL